MLSKYGNCTRLLKIKNKLKIVCFLQIKSGRILDILWAFLVKQLFHSRLLDKMITANSALRTSWAIHHLISNGSQRALVE